MSVEEFKAAWNLLGSVQDSKKTMHFEAEAYPHSQARIGMQTSSLVELLEDAKMSGLKDNKAAMDIVNKLVNPDPSDDWVFVSVGFGCQTSNDKRRDYTIEVSEKGGETSAEVLRDYFRMTGGKWYEFRISVTS